MASAQDTLLTDQSCTSLSELASSGNQVISIVQPEKLKPGELKYVAQIFVQRRNW